ncbi:hypothetical protein PRUPE_5G003800 [Prunus persica]|uniref:Uncharacterized protein n=1 Tax=Prunus persica TaxID=3760 RepID=A0A251P169_PRUPE|nr:hypothetical protein PRUPE_5G003800 [Prunus persica]
MVKMETYSEFGDQTNPTMKELSVTPPLSSPFSISHHPQNTEQTPQPTPISHPRLPPPFLWHRWDHELLMSMKAGNIKYEVSNGVFDVVLRLAIFGRQ